MISITDPLDIAIIVGVLIVVVLGIRHFSRKGKGSTAAVMKTEKKIEKKEHELERLLQKKITLIRELRSALESGNKNDQAAAVKGIEELINKQARLLAEMVSLDTKELAHLKHLNIHVKGPEQQKISRVIAAVETEWGEMDSRKLNAKGMELSSQDAYSRGVGYLAINLLHLHSHFREISAVLGKQKKALAKAPDPNPLESLVRDEDTLIKYILANMKDINTYIKQLDSARAAEEGGPFLVVEGHPVDVILDSGKKETVGRKEKIRLGLLPQRFCMGADHKQCSVLLNNGTPEIAATITRRWGDCCMLQREGEAVKKIKEGESFSLSGGYEFRFSAS